jgi:hypothetical protein
MDAWAVVSLALGMRQGIWPTDRLAFVITGSAGRSALDRAERRTLRPITDPDSVPSLPPSPYSIQVDAHGSEPVQLSIQLSGKDAQ